MDKNIFNEMSLELKGDLVFRTGEFVSAREYGFLKFALYKCKDFYCEIHIQKDTLKILDVAILEDLSIYFL